MPLLYEAWMIGGATFLGIAALLGGGLGLITRHEIHHYKEESDKERRMIKEILQNTNVLDGLRRLYFK